MKERKGGSLSQSTQIVYRIMKGLLLLNHEPHFSCLYTLLPVYVIGITNMRLAGDEYYVLCGNVDSQLHVFEIIDNS